MRFCFLLLMVSPMALADCSIQESQFEEWNTKYADKIQISIEPINSTFSVTISVATDIESKKFNSIALVADSLENPSFFAPLRSIKENEKQVSWFVIDAGNVREHTIVADFGSGCGISVAKRVLYK